MTPVAFRRTQDVRGWIIFGLILFVLSGCHDTRTAKSTIGTAAVSLRDNDYEGFRDTLMSPAKEQWGTPQGFQKLRQLLPKDRTKLLNLEMVRREYCGHNSCVKRYYEGQVGTSASDGASQVLLDVAVMCLKVAKDRECWIYHVKSHGDHLE